VNPLKISLVTPAARAARTGNRHTAARWARLLRSQGHRVEVAQTWTGRSADLMIALHARRSHTSIVRYARAFPQRPLVVVLTGTDIYRDIRTDLDARQSLSLATRLVVLQEAALLELPPSLRAKTRVIYQSARSAPANPRRTGTFEIVVSGHLREEKDPFCAARALAHLPQASRVRVTHIGRALAADMEQSARTLMAQEPRYRWLGEVAHARALRILARAAALVVSSRMEGGANVISEALAAGVPVLASHISGNLGMLGADYPGYYPPGDVRALAALMVRAETDASYLAQLRRACAARANLVSPERESRALHDLLAELHDGAAHGAPDTPAHASFERPLGS
jgi:putative glycosyltransferase (TIGR04348 family)